MRYTPTSNFSHQPKLARAKDPGLLIAFEGLDGSGKSTQRRLLKSWLRSMDEDVVVTKWNSSSELKPLIKQRKNDRSLDPTSFAALHAADFWRRYETKIVPALADGKIVLADRYIFTGVARDAARGLDRTLGAKLYENARKPDIVFYFSTTVDTCARRIVGSREMKFYEAGQDVTGIDDPYESFRCFGSRVAFEYSRLSEMFEFVVVDAELPVYDQHHIIRETYLTLKPLRLIPSHFEPQSLLSPVDV